MLITAYTAPLGSLIVIVPAGASIPLIVKLPKSPCLYDVARGPTVSAKAEIVNGTLLIFRPAASVMLSWYEPIDHSGRTVKLPRKQPVAFVETLVHGAIYSIGRVSLHVELKIVNDSAVPNSCLKLFACTITTPFLAALAGVRITSVVAVTVNVVSAVKSASSTAATMQSPTGSVGTVTVTPVDEVNADTVTVATTCPLIVTFAFVPVKP